MTKAEILELCRGAKNAQGGDCGFDEMPVNVEYYDNKDKHWSPTGKSLQRVIIACTEENYEYRIRPEPQYRPFTKDDWELFVGKPLCNRKISTTLQRIVTDFSNEKIWFANTDAANYNNLLEHYTFIDGSPCGVKL